MEEWKKPQYGPNLGNKAVYISHGGMYVCTCMKMENKEMLDIEKKNHLQSQHEEADTLLAFQTSSISSSHDSVCGLGYAALQFHGAMMPPSITVAWIEGRHM